MINFKDDTFQFQIQIKSFYDIWGEIGTEIGNCSFKQEISFARLGKRIRELTN